jgi:hypothetical protein
VSWPRRQAKGHAVTSIEWSETGSAAPESQAATPRQYCHPFDLNLTSELVVLFAAAHIPTLRLRETMLQYQGRTAPSHFLYKIWGHCSLSVLLAAATGALGDGAADCIAGVQRNGSVPSGTRSRYVAKTAATDAVGMSRTCRSKNAMITASRARRAELAPINCPPDFSCLSMRS